MPLLRACPAYLGGVRVKNIEVGELALICVLPGWVIGCAEGIP